MWSFSVKTFHLFNHVQIIFITRTSRVSELQSLKVRFWSRFWSCYFGLEIVWHLSVNTWQAVWSTVCLDGSCASLWHINYLCWSFFAFLADSSLRTLLGTSSLQVQVGMCSVKIANLARQDHLVKMAKFFRFIRRLHALHFLWKL